MVVQADEYVWVRICSRFSLSESGVRIERILLEGFGMHEDEQVVGNDLVALHLLRRPRGAAGGLLPSGLASNAEE
jgi:hypothetical protein